MGKLILDYNTYKSETKTSKEEEIFNLVKKQNSHLIEEYLEKSNDWEALYHLSPYRGNIIFPCLVSQNDDCLEIGSECGAITGSILKNSEKLDCIEMSLQQSEINFERHKKHELLNIFVGDLFHIAPNLGKKYDKIFIIGALAKASLYCPNRDNPYLEMLLNVKKLLKDNGQIFIAMPNKYGMKYFCGAKEDYTGQAFASIEGFQSREYQTFSSLQLRKMLADAGFKKVYFYYPLPDYKFPNAIYSEDHLPEMNEITNVYHSLDRERAIVFSEDKALNEAANAKMFEVFANSFLVKAGN